MPKSVIYAVGDAHLQREGLEHLPQPWEDGLRADPGSGQFEWWYFDSQFDDGSAAVVVFATKPLTNPELPLTPGVQLTITTPDGRQQRQFPFSPVESFSAAQDRCQVRIGPNWVHGNLQRYELHAEAEGMGADLFFTSLVPPWRPGAGKVFFGGEQRYFAWLSAIPFGRVEGCLTYEGKTVPVQGTGYHDHNWGNVNLGQVMSRWTWGRAHVGEFSTIFVEQVARKAYGSQRIPVFMLARGGKILVEDGLPLRMHARDFQSYPGGRRFPQAVDFLWEQDNQRVLLELRAPQVIEALSLIGHLSPWKRRLIRLFANPYYFRLRADLKLSVDLRDVQAHEEGKALFELMLLR